MHVIKLNIRKSQDESKSQDKSQDELVHLDLFLYMMVDIKIETQVKIVKIVLTYYVIIKIISDFLC